ncbi:unnamed protein product [Cylicocyclus nassatus]|uniref:Uncharacterized protein n=1 Tax=Cylicocyclus nassatus TaxID=53992 RepID=A0AA36DW37_CYLNA|nr:unnamed protein product [Cylicocyclus nassatus]
MQSLSLWFCLITLENSVLHSKINGQISDNDGSNERTTTGASSISLSSTSSSLKLITTAKKTWRMVKTSDKPTKYEQKNHATLQCYIGEFDKGNCKGVCVMREKYSRDRKVSSSYLERTYHCQQFSKYAESAVNMCTDVKVPYPNLKVYKSQNYTYVKYCCQTDFCNKRKKLKPLLAKFLSQRENVDQIYFDYFVIYLELVVITSVALWPFVIMINEKKKERKLYAVLNQPLEKGIDQEENVPAMKMKRKVAKPVTGQLNFKELCHELTNMELRIRKDCVEISSKAFPSYNQFELVAGGNGHDLVKVDRTMIASYETYVMTHLVENGPYVYDWTPFELVSLLSQAADFFEGEDTMLTLRAPITVIGDIRGQYQDLHRWLAVTGFPPRQKVLFLGGVIDREEPGSLDCLAFIAAMKMSFLQEKLDSRYAYFECNTGLI